MVTPSSCNNDTS